MEKILLYILIFWIGCASCYDDDSAKSFKLINPIVIDMGAMPSEFIVYQYGTLKVVPVIYKEGLDDSNLHFEWRIKGYGADRLLDHGMVLQAIIHEEQQVDPYTLLLVVTDSTSGLKEVRSWKLQVSSQLSTGLMVADTKDGQVGDVSLITAFNFANLNDDKQDTLFRHIYSQGNGGGMNGPIISMANSNYTTERLTTLVSDRDICRIDPASYIKREGLEDMFYLPMKDDVVPMGVHFLDVSYPGEYVVLDGLLYYRNIYWGAKKYGYHYQMNDGSKYAVSEIFLFPKNYSRKYTGIAFDSLNGRFVSLPDDADYGQLQQLKSSGGELEISQLKNKKCVHIGLGKDKKIQVVLQDVVTGHNYIYSMTFGLQDVMSSIKRITDLSGCIGINGAKYFTFSPLEEVMYYVVGNKIYAALLTSENPVSHKCYETKDAGELITSMMIWKGAGRIYYTAGENGKDREMKADSRMLVITTYDGEEGKVITLPIENLGAGNISADRKYHKEYTGFNRITTIAPQIK